MREQQGPPPLRVRTTQQPQPQQALQAQTASQPQVPPNPLVSTCTMNGMHPSAVVGLPSPAAHQSELNFIYSMVEELSRHLADNKRALEDVVAGVGRVRQRAQSRSLSNNDILQSSADGIREQEGNLEAVISVLNEALEQAKSSRDANLNLLNDYADRLARMLRQLHEYKARHVADVAAWHRSYRVQLAEERAENGRLRSHMWAMQARAGRANEALRQLRAALEVDQQRWDARVLQRAHRQELRFWKRLAMPELADDDPYWSDDDDLIDSAEKVRLLDVAEAMKRRAEEDKKKAAESASFEADSDADSDESRDGDRIEQPIMGGVPMQREDGWRGMRSAPPSRPSSAAGSTGSSGG